MVCKQPLLTAGLAPVAPSSRGTNDSTKHDHVTLLRSPCFLSSLVVTFCVLLVIGFPSSSCQTTKSKNVICYYRYWGGLSVSDIDLSICTHLVYHYAYIPYRDLVIKVDPDMGEMLEQLKDLKVSNPSLKILLAVSGLSIYSSKVRSSYENRQTFYTNAINFLRSWDFDGVDFLWDNYVGQDTITLAQEIRAFLNDEATSSGREPLMFMLQVPGWTRAMALAEGVDFQPLGEAVDILEVTLSDENMPVTFPHYTTGLANPLYGNGGYRGNVSASIINYLDAGVAPEKLHMAIQLSAALFDLSDPQLTGVGAPVPELYWLDSLSYGQVCERLLVNGYTTQVDPEGLVNFAYKGNQWFTYEDPASLEKKMNYVNDHNLGGVGVQYLSFDDYSGKLCNRGKFPLTSTLYRLA